jgi:hypothetical protein
MVGGIGGRALLQPLPPPIPDQQPPLPSQKPDGAQPILPGEGLSLPVPNPDTLLDAAANLVIRKYQSTSCEELSNMKPASDKGSQAGGGAQAAIQQKAIELLRKNPEIRKEFINRVAPPIANKMFDCNIIP